MLQNLRSLGVQKGLPSVATALIWGAAALGTAYWVLQFPSGLVERGDSGPVTDHAVSMDMAPQLVRALGGAQVAPAAHAPEAGRLQLLGVIAGPSGQGSALVASDGQAPKPYRVGQTVSEGLILQSLSPRRAQLGASLNGPVRLELQLPADKNP
jgi:general secretion pathway protein C